MPTMMRQGDVLLIAAKPRRWRLALEVPRVGGRVILAYGELSGHAHAVHASNARLLETLTGRLFLEVTERPAELRHEEHGEVRVPPGLWRVVVQRELGNEERRARAIPVSD